MEDGAMHLVPGRSIGFMTLGCSLHEILTTIKAEVRAFPRFQLYHDDSRPIASPVHIVLPDNGLRLQFDGPDQRLRLIEVLDFTKARLVYKDVEVFKPTEGHGSILAAPSGPKFRHIYDKLLGPTYGGEYMPPGNGDSNANGIYNLSYPGVAFNFPVQHSAYSPKKDFISLLSSSATGPAKSMAIFNGESWQKARGSLFTAPAPNPRTLALSGKGKEGSPDEIELVRVHGEGRIELMRRSSPSFWIILSETTPQDLIMELGAPDSIYRKNDHRLLIHKDRRISDVSETSGARLTPDELLGSDHDSAIDSDNDDDWEGDEEAAIGAQEREVAAAEHFYNYYHHGFDILISQPTQISPPSQTSDSNASESQGELSAQPLNHLTATKIIFHGNVPGSYQFNRHRRSRWSLNHVSSKLRKEPLHSEMMFADISRELKQVYRDYYATEEEERLQQRGMALNRGWGDSPGSSVELLGGWEDSSNKKNRFAGAGSDMLEGAGDVGNVELFGFPGLVFEVLKNGACQPKKKVSEWVLARPKNLRGIAEEAGASKMSPAAISDNSPAEDATMVVPTRLLRASWSSTLRLPKSTFPPRPLPASTAEYLRRCTAEHYAWQQSARSAPDADGKLPATFTLHDGPPYANGPLHVGHALNKITKDLICRFQVGQGKHVSYVPGWDCHGLPIEIKALQAQKKDLTQTDPVGVREAATELATNAIEKQMQGFKEWAVMGDWDNAYKTMEKGFEIRQLEVFKKMFEAGLIYRQYKPVYWSPSSRTALAEAELEYDENYKSLAAFVRFPVHVTNELHDGAFASIAEPLSVVIWTTTPWTLPANRAIAVHKDILYSVVQDPEKDNEKIIIATSRVEEYQKMLGRDLVVVLSKLRGSDLAGQLSYDNPFQKANGLQPILHADFVTDSSGTGLVHMAPGHGMDDYHACGALGIEAFAPVDDAGAFTKEAFPEQPELFEGLAVSDLKKTGSNAILNYLDKQNLLRAKHNYRHKYPIDWRTKEPVIVRATAQWFANVDNIKDSAMKAIENVNFMPGTGRSRLESFIQGRSQWCISRQRAWGVPIPTLYKVLEDGQVEAAMDAETIQHIINVIKERGIDAWWTDAQDDPAWKPQHLNGSYVRGRDTMDVWFDSGTSWSMLAPRGDRPVADVYFEGTDQHRGWFQSSLLTHVATQSSENGHVKAPYETLITHGFTLDSDGRKMSKSQGNVINPSQIMSGELLPSVKRKKQKGEKQAESKGSAPTYDAMGSDALRLWVASSDYTRDVTIGQPVLMSVNQALHKYRVTFKWLLGVLSLPSCPPLYRSFSHVCNELVGQRDLEASRAPLKHLADRLAVHRLARVSHDVHGYYTKYEFFKGVNLINRYITNDLSAFYFETLKDRIYTGHKADCQELQKVIGLIFYELMQMLAPVCPLLVEEAWDYTPEALKNNSVHPARTIWTPLPRADPQTEAFLTETQNYIDRINTAVKAAQERVRADKKLGSSLESAVAIHSGSGEPCQWFSSHFSKALTGTDAQAFPEGLSPAQRDELAGLFVVSGVRMGWTPETMIEGGGYSEEEAFVANEEKGWSGSVVVHQALAEKCPRCWRYQKEEDNELCGRCEEVTKEET